MDGEFRQKMKEWVIALLVPFMLFAAWWSVTTVNKQNDATRLEIICKTEIYNIQQLKAATQISRALGLPTRFEIPERSEECK